MEHEDIIQETTASSCCDDRRDTGTDDTTSMLEEERRIRVNTPQRNHDDESEVLPFFRIYFQSKGAPQLLVCSLMLSMGIGSVVSIVPELVADRFARLAHEYTGDPCSTFGRDNLPDACVGGGLDASNAAALGVLGKNILILIFAGIVGSSSDCRGRKAFLCVSFLLSALAPLVLVLLQLFETMSPVWYYAADCSNGLISAMTIALTMLSDTLPPKLRAPGFGLFLSAFMTGFAVSQMLAIFLSHIGVSIASTAMMLAGSLFTLCFVPETLSTEAKTKAIEKQQSSEEGGVLQIVTRPLREMRILNRDKFFRRLAFLSFCSAMIYSSDTTLVVYYMEQHLSIGYRDIAYMLAIMSFLGVLVQVCLLKAAIRWFGEKKTLFIGFCFGTIHNFIYAISNSELMIFFGLIVSELTSLTFPVLVALRSFNVGIDEQGHVQGAFFSLASVANAIGPVTLQAIYAKTKTLPYPLPGSLFFFASAVYLSAVIVTYFLPSDQANCHETANRNEAGHSAECVEDSYESESQEPLLLT